MLKIKKKEIKERKKKKDAQPDRNQEEIPDTPKLRTILQNNQYELFESVKVMKSQRKTEGLFNPD